MQLWIPRLATITRRGVYQIAQTAPKLSAKWYNRIASQVTMHHTAWCSVVCGFIIRKAYKPHRTASSIYINIFIFLILNILLINSLILLKKINTLITLVSPQKNRRKTHFRPYIFTWFPLWSLTFFFTTFSPYPEKRVSFLSLPLHHRRKLHMWQTEVDVAIKIIIKNVIWH